MNTQSAAPGWYPDPDGSGGSRWWDGQRWVASSLAPGQVPAPWKVPARRSAWWRLNRRWAILAGGVVAVIAILILITHSDKYSDTERDYLHALKSQAKPGWQLDNDDDLVAQGHESCDALRGGRTASKDIAIGIWGPHSAGESFARTAAAIRFFCPDQSYKLDDYLNRREDGPSSPPVERDPADPGPTLPGPSCRQRQNGGPWTICDNP